MSSDPPTTMTNSWGSDDLKLNDLLAHSESLNQLCLSTPRTLSPFQKASLHGMIKSWLKKKELSTGVLAIINSHESALFVVTSNAKLEKNHQGFAFDEPQQDPNVVEELNEIVRIVHK